jgi:lambda family phage portal protein
MSRVAAYLKRKYSSLLIRQFSALNGPAPALSARQYAAGRVTRTNGWSPVDPQINDLIRMSSPNVRARVRQLVRDFPYFARAVRLIADYSIGDGVDFQSKILDSNGNLLEKPSRLTEDGWKRFGDEADISRKLHLEEMSRLASYQDSECGEFFIIKHLLKDPKRYVPLALQMVEPDWLTSHNATPVGSRNTVDQGLEYNTDTGEIIAAHFEDPNSWGRPMRITADRFLHGFETLRPGQLRGISGFAPGVVITDDLKEVMEGEVDAAKYASKWLALITKDPSSIMNQMPGAGGFTDQGTPIEYLENAIIEYLRPGEKVEFPANNRPSANFPPFVRLILTMFAITTGIPLELLSGDYKGLNMAVTKVIRADFAHSLIPLKGRRIRQFYAPLHREVMDLSVLHDRLPFRDYFSNPYPYLRCKWYPPVMEPVDKLKDSKADIDNINAALECPQDVVARRTGREYEDVIKDIAKAREIRERHGVTVQEVSTALANNPAAVEEQD